MSYQDKTLTCVECGAQFLFTANEQAFYADRGFANQPKRCPSCRQSRKAQRTMATGANVQGAITSSSGSQRQLHIVTCDNCGGEARVPFVPRGNRPVYCSDCFTQQRAEYSRTARF